MSATLASGGSTGSVPGVASVSVTGSPVGRLAVRLLRASALVSSARGAAGAGPGAHLVCCVLESDLTVVPCIDGRVAGVMLGFGFCCWVW